MNIKRSEKMHLGPMVIISIVLILCAMIFLTTQNNRNETGIPDEVASLVKNYLNAYKNGTEESFIYAHFESEFIQSAYINSGDKLIDYKIEKAEKINEDLYCFTLLVKTETMTLHSGDVYQRVYNFVGRIENKWYYINGVYNIPLEIQNNLDISKYTYTDENIVDPGDIVGEFIVE